MRTTIRMNEELARRAKQYAAKHDRTFTQVIEEAVMQFLSNGNGGSAAPKKRTVLPTVGAASGRKMTAAQYRKMIEQADWEYDMKKLGLARENPGR